MARRAVRLGGIEILVLDEADRMLDMGFRPAVDRIVRECPRDRQTLFFSATLDGDAGRIAKEYTHDAVRHEHTPEPVDASQVEHRFVPVVHEEKLDALVSELKARPRAHARVRAHQARRRPAGQAAREPAASTPSPCTATSRSRQREKALARFESGKVDTLVATDVAARGIHVTGISHVINFDPPEDREGYVHRVGRTGRAGKTGVGITFVNADQAGDVGKIAAALDLHEEYESAGFTRPKARPHTSGGGGSQRRSRSYRSKRSRW